MVGSIQRESHEEQGMMQDKLQDILAKWRSSHRNAGAHTGLIARRAVMTGAVAIAGLGAAATKASAAPLTHGGPLFGPVPDREGAVRWSRLTGVVLANDGTVVSVAPEIMELDGQVAAFDGYMIPYDDATRQRRFLVTPYQVDCPYCAPGGAVGLVEVFARRPVALTQRPFSVRGRFAVVPTFETGFLYKLTDATI
jgi:hypothetical protein